jgi:hypothetical protein
MGFLRERPGERGGASEEDNSAAAFRAMPEMPAGAAGEGLPRVWLYPELCSY